MKQHKIDINTERAKSLYAESLYVGKVELQLSECREVNESLREENLNLRMGLRRADDENELLRKSINGLMDLLSQCHKEKSCQINRQ